MAPIDADTGRASALDNRIGRTSGRDRIRVAIDDLPTVVLGPKHTRDPQSNRRQLTGTADLRPVSLDLDEACEVRVCVRCDPLEAHDLAVTIESCGPTDRLRDLFPPAHEGSERISDGDVVT